MPLSHLKVIDLTRARAGPNCARVFADWGAQVTKIEGPEDGITGARDGSDFQNLHRNKRSLSLNLKEAEGRDILLRMVKDSDILLENYRPAVKERLGIGYETIRAINPRLVYGSISGFGQEGPYRDRPGVDQIAQGMGGLMSVTGFPGQGPLRVGVAIADLTAGMFCAIGLLIALAERERSGVGQWVQTSLLQAQIAMLDFQATRWLIDGVVPGQTGNDHPTGIATGTHATADGHINIGGAGGMMWKRFCQAIGAERFLEDPRYKKEIDRRKNRDALNAEIAEIMKTRASAEWIEILNRAGVPCGPIYRIDQMFADPQVRQLGIAQKIEHPKLGTQTLVGQAMTLSRTPSRLRTATPEHGEHSEQILRELGYDEAAIGKLRERKII
ncbi:MAG: formyl-CoA transferase [Betaproteobacteria bacterium RIFCSPLOWO2_02_FULL_62_17]|nr:MAG: formyl-CoA transferase [Betaproteobacteria bacterium RIFCSPLOWO2_02_FULL_62_17]